ncbi:MAG: hypothetical protein WC701_06970 [Kiritimatiellales bacterium]
MICLLVGIGLFALGAEPDVYISVAPLGFSEMLLDLRRTDDDHVLDTQKILSRYKTPEYEMRDITGDGVDEVLVYTRGGGTECVIDQLSIYAVHGDKLVEAARFDLEGSASVNPGCRQLILPDGKQEELALKEVRSNGSVEFLPDGVILYSCASAQWDCGELSLDFKVERYRFNPAAAKFERQSQ